MESFAVEKYVGWSPTYSHNGYLEILLNLGIVGTGLFLVFLWKGMTRVVHLAEERDDKKDLWPLAFLMFFVVHNFAECTIIWQNCFEWSLSIATVISSDPIVQDMIEGAKGTSEAESDDPELPFALDHNLSTPRDGAASWVTMQATGNSNFNRTTPPAWPFASPLFDGPNSCAIFSALAQLTFTKTSTPAIEVIVVDNDSSRSAKPACQLPDFPWTIRYICEPNRGIARARNSAIAAARSPAFLAFIDDDEVPHANWLDELMWTQSQFQADVVSGPVLPAYTADVPQWIRNGGFFRRPVFRTGDVVKLSSTNNALVRSSVLATVPGFDEQFNLTGAEDSHFFLRIRESGFKMIFSSAAVVYEPITEQRANLSWLLRRGYQAGNSWALCEGHVKPQDSAARGLKGHCPYVPRHCPLARFSLAR